jgi:23S rRNA (uridine2552-2'-O)-methyltransferase
MALKFCKIHLQKDGVFIAKLIRGKAEPTFIKELKQYFKQVKLFKPKASYKGSTEFYVIALGFLEHSKIYPDF